MGGRHAIGRMNIHVAWWMIGAGMAAGAVLGLWSFGGPIEPPPGFRAFDDLPRRLTRLGHIAAIALPALNLLYVPWMRRARWGDPVRRAGCRSPARSACRACSCWRRSGVPADMRCRFRWRR
jgi:hypothetical protein